MVWQANPYSLPLLGATLIAGIVTATAWRRRPAPGAVPLSLLSLAVAIWCLLYAWYWAEAATDLQVVALNAITVGAALAPVAFLAFALEITGRRAWLTRHLLVAQAVIYAATLLLAWTDGWHHLWNSAVSAVSLNGLHAIAATPGWGYWILGNGYGYLVTLVGYVLLGREYWTARGVYRMQYGLILVAATVPLAASLASEFRLSPWPDLDLAPIAFAVSGPLLAYAIFRFRLLDLVPIARSVLVDRMTDAIVVLDRQNRVLDINTAALTLVGWRGPAPLGQPAVPLFSVWPEIMARYAEAYEASADVQPRPDLTLELLITPLRGRTGELNGRLIVLRDVTRQRRIDRELREANERLRAQLAEIEQLHELLHEQAIRDSLTGLFNRRYLEESLTSELARAARERRPVSVVFIDLDHFKLVNDTHGHNAGDRVLQALAQYVAHNSRAADVVCRYGGEELLVILSGAEAAVAAQRAEQWRQGIAAQPIAVDDLTLNMTISAGVAAYPADGSTVDGLLQAADAALYQAKSDGRNCVRRAAPPQARSPHVAEA